MSLPAKERPAEAAAGASWPAAVRLLSWLGPWRSEASVPKRIERRTSILPAIGDQRPFECWVYVPRGRVLGAYLIAPGLHFAGPSDPRADRFARILAHAGFLVVAPFLPDFIALQVDDRVATDLARAFELLLAQPELPSGCKPGIFSISFGSYPALRVAASPAHRHQVGGVVVFGGYADFEAAIRFCIGADRIPADPRPYDPLNVPVVFLNLLDALGLDPTAKQTLADAWREYVGITWGRPAMRRGEGTREVATSIAERLPASLQETFYLGCGFDPALVNRVQALLAARPFPPSFADPRPHLASLAAPVFLIHGAEDDVIPFEQLEVLAKAMPAELEVHTFLTGWYQHTGSAAKGSLSWLRGALREVRTMLGMLRAIARAGTCRRDPGVLRELEPSSETDDPPR